METIAPVTPNRSWFRRGLVALIAVGVVSAAIVGALLVHTRTAHAATPIPQYVSLAHTVSARIGTATLVGPHNPNTSISILLVLRPNNQAKLDALMKAINTKGNPLYHHWLSTGEFAAEFGPTAAQKATYTALMTSAGLHAVANPNGTFLPRFVGTTAQVQHAFHTQINDYRLPNGTVGFANATAIMIPITLVGLISGVVGLASF